MLHRNNKGAFTSRPPSSFPESSYGSQAYFGRTIGAPRTGDSGHLPHPMTSLTKMPVGPPPRTVAPKLPEAPRGILGVSSASGAGRTFSPAASANVASTAAAMGVHKRAADAARQQQHAFPTAAPSSGAQRKKKWRPHCQHPTCLRPASYAGSSDSEPVFCEKHKTSGQQNVVHPNRGDCEFVGCGRVSAYASTEDTRARFCHLHKEAGMVKVRDRIGTRCEESTCIKQASFAMDGDRYPKFCKEHRQSNMVNIRNQRCIAPGCTRGASFAATGGERGQFCSEHKEENMVNTRRRSRCIAPGCTSREPIYVIDGQQLPKYCAGHRGPDFLRPHPTNKAQCVLPECTRPLTLAARGEEQRLVCDMHEAGSTHSDTQNDGGARPKSFTAATTTTTQGGDVVAARGNSSGGGSYIQQDRVVDPNHNRLPPHSQSSDAGISSASPPGTRRAARIPRALRYADTSSGVKEGIRIPLFAHHPGTAEQPRGPRRRFDGGKRFSDQQQPGSSKHPRRMEHPGAQPSRGNPAAPAPSGSSSLRAAPSEEVGGFDDERESVALMKRKGKGKAYRSHHQSAFPAAYNGAAGTARSHRRIPMQDESSIDGVEPSQATNIKRHTDQPASVRGGGGRHEQQQQERSTVRLLHMDDPTGTARLDSSPTHPGKRTRSSAAPPAAMLTAVKQEIGAEHETMISLEKGLRHGGEVSYDTQRVAAGGVEPGDGTMERENSKEPESATPDTTPATTDEEEEEDSSSSSSSSSVNSTRTKRTTSLTDTRPSGYSPTPFYYTLVNALTGKRKRP